MAAPDDIGSARADGTEGLGGRAAGNPTEGPSRNGSGARSRTGAGPRTGTGTGTGAAGGRSGRPRAVPRQVEGDPTDEILAAASRLFGRQGVGGTTMARIAAESGLGPSSLYYYFGRKEEVVVALVARANVIPLSLLERVEAEPAPPATQLFRFVRGDVVALCGLPFDINEVHRIAARDREAFAGYWGERTELESGLARIVRAGVADGSFRPVDPRLTALTVMANDEAVQNWYRYAPGPWRDPHAVGTFCADLVVSGLLERRSRLEAVRRRADRLDALAGG